MKYFITFFLLMIGRMTFAQKDVYLFIGTYTSGKSQGIYVYKFNTENADNHFVTAVGASNPSYLAISPNKKFVYAVNENKNGIVTAYSFNKAAEKLMPINTQPSGGSDPCFVSIDASGKWLFTGNYSSGTVALFPLQPSGALDPARQIIQHSGSGPDTGRQKSAHVHSTNLSGDQRYLYVADLGTDKIMTYNFDNKPGTLFPASIPFTSLKPGSGPRHMAFGKGNTAVYIVEEMTGYISMYAVNKDKLRFSQRTSSLPKDFKGFVSAADVHVSQEGNFLYCSNRGDLNTISIFRINHFNGRLSLINNQPTLGKTPRNFNFDPSGNFLLVANQNSDEIVIFRIDKKTGLLTDTGKRISVPSPVCIKWID